jgi:hypothetical protein
MLQDRAFVLRGWNYEEIKSKCQSVRLLPNVISLKTTGQQGMYSVILSKCEPCPSPVRLEKGSPKTIVDPAQTMCDILRSWTDMEQMYKKRERRIAQRRHTKMKISVTEAFGCFSIREDSTLFRAVCGFMEGSQEGSAENRWLVDDYVKRLDKTEDEEGATRRATKFGWKEPLSQIVSFTYNGEVAKQLEDNVLRKKRLIAHNALALNELFMSLVRASFTVLNRFLRNTFFSRS